MRYSELAWDSEGVSGPEPPSQQPPPPFTAAAAAAAVHAAEPNAPQGRYQQSMSSFTMPALDEQLSREHLVGPQTRAKATLTNSA